MAAQDDDSREILTRPVSIEQEEAEQRVQARIVSKMKRIYSEQTPVRSVLRYKPYYEYKTTLEKRYFFGDNLEEDGAIIVDGLTGVTRPILDQDIEVETKVVPSEAILDTKLDRDEADREANSRRMQIEHREKGDVEMDDEPRRVHKPVWIVELSNGEVNVVDADDGRVVSDVLLG